VSESCGNCRFWLSKQADEGECRRYAPRPTLRPREDEEGTVLPLFAYFPQMFEDEWCGEFQPRPGNPVHA
jgi:hypothetical protein